MKSALVENPFVLSAIVIFGLASVFGLSRFLERNRPPLPDSYVDQDLALEGKKLKKYSMGLNGLIADWYWILALQYVGNKVIQAPDGQYNLDDLRPLNPRLLYPYLDNSTTLDPRFIPAYAYGATVLPAIDSNQAIALCEKGIANNPSEWILYHHLGFIYWKLKDYENATAAYETGATIAGSREWMKMMAARMRTEGGSRETARALYVQVIEEGEDTMDQSIKDIARLRLQELDSLDEREAIQQALNSFAKKNNRCVNNWREILPQLQHLDSANQIEFRIDISNNLVDPSLVPYVLDRTTCTVGLAPSSRIPR